MLGILFLRVPLRDLFLDEKDPCAADPGKGCPSDNLSLDQIKCLKGVWWMPWQQEAMKDVILCDKLWGAENRL